MGCYREREQEEKRPKVAKSLSDCAEAAVGRWDQTLRVMGVVLENSLSPCKEQ